MGTVGGPRTRRYHGLLCTATRPPTGRVLLVNGLTETVFDGHVARALDTQRYVGAIHPDGHTHIEQFTIDPWPTWTFALDEAQLVREILVLRGRSGTIVRWRYEPRSKRAQRTATLAVRPLVSGRDTHALHHENAVLDPRCKIGTGLVELAPYPGSIPGVRLRHDGSFRAPAPRDTPLDPLIPCRRR